MGRENKVWLKEIINGDKVDTQKKERIQQLIVDMIVEYIRKEQQKPCNENEKMKESKKD